MAIQMHNQSNGENIPELELLLDVRTRWDSLYKMLEHMKALQPVIQLVLPKFGSELMQRTGTGRTELTVRFSSSSVQPLPLSVRFSVLRFPQFQEPVLNRFEQDRTVNILKGNHQEITLIFVEFFRHQQ